MQSVLNQKLSCRFKGDLALLCLFTLVVGCVSTEYNSNVVRGVVPNPGRTCFKNECFDIYTADGMLVDGFNLPQGEYEMTTNTVLGSVTVGSVTVPGSEEPIIITVHIKPNNVMLIEDEDFNFTMNTVTGEMESLNITTAIDNNMRKAIENMAGELSSRLMTRGFVSTGDVLKDSANISSPVFGTIKVSSERHVLGITTYNGKNYAVVRGKGYGTFRYWENGKSFNGKATISTLMLHDPTTGISMYDWMALELRIKGKVNMRIVLITETTIRRK